MSASRAGAIRVVCCDDRFAVGRGGHIQVVWPGFLDPPARFYAVHADHDVVGKRPWLASLGAAEAFAPADDAKRVRSRPLESLDLRRGHVRGAELGAAVQVVPVDVVIVGDLKTLASY